MKKAKMKNLHVKTSAQRILVLLLALLLCLLLSHTAVAATISGTVYESDGKTPITGKDIGVLVCQGDPCGNYQYIASALVNGENGTYMIAGIPAGEYCMRTFTDENYPDEWWASPASARDCGMAQKITLTEDASVTGKDFQLDTGGSISGTVYEFDGKTPITGKVIHIEVYQGDPCGNRLDIDSALVNGENGTYTIIGLGIGEYYLITQTSEDYLDEWWSSTDSVQDCGGAQKITVGEGEAVTGINFQLGPGATISGTIFQIDGKTPITGKTIQVKVYQGNPCGEKETIEFGWINSENGNYTIGGLSPGEYYLQAGEVRFMGKYEWWEWWAAPLSVQECGEAQKIMVDELAAVTGKNFQLDGASISGTVFESDGKTPIIGKSIQVSVYQGDPCGKKQYVDRVWVNEQNGTYTISLLPAGEYYLITGDSTNYYDEWWADPESLRDCGGAQKITLGEGAAVTGKNFQLDLGASISGTVFASDGKTPITEKDIRVHAYQGDPCGNLQRAGEALASEQNGTYTVGPLPPGDYYLKTYTSKKYYDEWWAVPESLRDCSSAQKISVQEGEAVTGKNLQLDPGGSISGTVFKSDGKTPMTGKYVSVRLYQGDPCGNYQQVGSVSIDKQNGTYTVGLLPPGDYYLRTYTDENFVVEWWASPASVWDCGGAQKITLGEGETVTGKNFQLDPGGSISGTVFESDGETSIFDKSIRIYVCQGDPCGNRQYAGEASVNSQNGTYTISFLPPGEYYLQTDTAENYFDEWWASPASVRDCSGAQKITLGEGDAVTGKNFQMDPRYSRPTISGTVYESDGKTPITGKGIALHLFSTDAPMVNTYSVNPQNGRYTIEVSPGAYHLGTFTEENYIDEWWASPASVREYDNAQTITVAEGDSITGIDFQLDQGATISGTIFEFDGKTPMANKMISVAAYKGDPCGDFQRVSDEVLANHENGAYTIIGLPEGEYYLSAYPIYANYCAEWWASPSSIWDCGEAQKITLKEGEAASGKDFQLDPGATISGTIFESDGKTPIIGKNIWLSAYKGDPCGNPQRFGNGAINKEKGTYTIAGLPPGECYLKTDTEENYIGEWWSSPASVRECGNAQKITLDEGASVTGKNFQLDPGASISGMLFESDGKTPIGGHFNFVVAYKGDPCENPQQVGNIFRAENNGTYTIFPLTPGEYYLEASGGDYDYINEWWASPGSVWDCGKAQKITVGEGEAVIGKNFQLDIGATISGTVFMSDSKTPITGKNISVVAYMGEPCGNLQRVRTAAINRQNGTYTIAYLPTGEYYLQTETEENYIDEWWAPLDSVQNCANAQKISVAEAWDVSGKNFQLDPKDPIQPGDVNGDGKLGVDDIVLALQVASGANPLGIHLPADVNGDGNIGLPEAIYVFYKLITPVP